VRLWHQPGDSGEVNARCARRQISSVTRWRWRKLARIIFAQHAAGAGGGAAAANDGGGIGLRRRGIVWARGEISGKPA
jgi:hypothetical protein